MILLHLLRIALAIVLFYIVNWIGARSKPLDLGYVQMSVALQDDTAPLFNYLFKVLAPIVYIILLAALFQAVGWDCLCEDIYLIVVYYWAFRFLYVTVLGQLSLLNWRVQILYWVSSIALALWVNSIIDKVESVLPSPQSLLEQFWILIILFLYSIFNKMEFSREGAKKRIRHYTYKKVDAFKERFGHLVDEQFSQDFYKAVVYSIMIYEDFNRPALARFVERSIFHFSKKKHTYGIMQMTSTKPLSDEESVLMACNKIKADVMSFLPSGSYFDEGSICLSGVAGNIFDLYNPGDAEYGDQVSQVFSNIIQKYCPTLLEEMSRVDLMKDINPSNLK